MVVIPLFADQPANALRGAALGAGVALEAGPALAGSLAPALEGLLDDASYREAAGRVAAEAGALPPIEDAVRALEEIAAF